MGKFNIFPAILMRFKTKTFFSRDENINWINTTKGPALSSFRFTRTWVFLWLKRNR